MGKNLKEAKYFIFPSLYEGLPNALIEAVNNDLISWIYDKYSFNIIPKLGEFVSNDRESYQYLVESIRKFPNQEKFSEMIINEGFRKVKYRDLTFGIAALHSAWKF